MDTKGRVQNTAARLIAHTKNYHHVNPGVSQFTYGEELLSQAFNIASMSNITHLVDPSLRSENNILAKTVRRGERYIVEQSTQTRDLGGVLSVLKSYR